MIKKIKWLTIGLLAVASVGFAADCKPFYLRAEAGASWGMQADFSPDFIWDASNEGYKSDLGTAEMVGIAFGMDVHPLFSFGVSGTQRTKYKYEKYQTVPTGVVAGADSKTRYFNLDNSSYLIDLYFNRTNHPCSWVYDCCHTSVIPFIGVGIGLSNNRVYNFHTVREETVTTVPEGFVLHTVGSIENDYTTIQFGWKVELGLDFAFCEKARLGLAYRFFDGGDIVTNNYFWATPASPGEVTGLTVSDWRANLYANELSVSFTLDF